MNDASGSCIPPLGSHVTAIFPISVMTVYWQANGDAGVYFDSLSPTRTLSNFMSRNICTVLVGGFQKYLSNFKTLSHAFGMLGLDPRRGKNAY